MFTVFYSFIRQLIWSWRISSFFGLKYVLKLATVSSFLYGGCFAHSWKLIEKSMIFHFDRFDARAQPDAYLKTHYVDRHFSKAKVFRNRRFKSVTPFWSCVTKYFQVKSVYNYLKISITRTSKNTKISHLNFLSNVLRTRLTKICENFFTRTEHFSEKKTLKPFTIPCDNFQRSERSFLQVTKKIWQYSTFKMAF